LQPIISGDAGAALSPFGLIPAVTFTASSSLGQEAGGDQLMKTLALVNYYEILEVSQDASAESVRLAVKRQRRTWVKRQQIPAAERRREAENRMALIDAAETTLLDPEARRAFDVRLARYVPPAPRTEQAAEGGDWLRLARELLDHGDAPSAAYAARQATDRQALRHEAWAVRGRASFLSGQDQDAISEFAEALRLSPDSEEYLFDLGSVYESTGRDKPALDCYEQAAQIAPGNPLYQVAISGIYLDNNMPEKALPILEKVHASHPKIDEFTFYFAAVLNEAALRSWTPVGPARVITKLRQIEPSRLVLQRAENLNPADDNLRATISRNLRLVDAAERRRLRVPGFTSAAKISVGIASASSRAAGRAGACGVLLIFYASMVGLCWIAFAANPDLGIAALVLAIGLLFHLSWRPGWKWNQIDARGITVIQGTSAGQHMEHRGR
jgi:Flp pilus assembly protein TadD